MAVLQLLQAFHGVASIPERLFTILLALYLFPPTTQVALICFHKLFCTLICIVLDELTTSCHKQVFLAFFPGGPSGREYTSCIPNLAKWQKFKGKLIHGGSRWSLVSKALG
jgi:hypothetical protein